MTGATLLDASALVALARGEDGGDRVAEVIDGSYVTAANWAEFLLVMRRFGVDVERAGAFVRALGPRIVDTDVRDAEYAAAITAPPGLLSLGDRLCLGAARSLDATVLTADRAWAGVDHGVELEMIR